MSTTGSAKNASDGRRFLVFSLGEAAFALALSQVREVIALPDIRPVPNTPPYFLGVTNLRGHIISVVDLRKKMNIDRMDNDRETTVIILDLVDASIGVVVTRVNYVLNLGKEEKISKPTLESNEATNCIEGVIKKDKELILFLDLAKALTAADMQVVAAAAQKPAEEKSQAA